MWVIKCTDNGKFTGAYVCSGRRSSYTFSLEHADRYSTREQAQQNCCGNEYPVRVEDLLS